MKFHMVYYKKKTKQHRGFYYQIPNTSRETHAHVSQMTVRFFHVQAFKSTCAYLGGNDPVVCKPLRNIMAMLWELVCYVNCACVTLMGRVEALEEMRRDGSVKQARDINNCC